MIRRLGAPTPLSDDAGLRGFVVLEGRLEVSGAPYRRLRDGVEVGAETVSTCPGSSSGRWHPPRTAFCQAGRLTLRQGVHRVALEASVEVMRGSVEGRTRNTLFQSGPEILRRAVEATPAMLRHRVVVRSVSDGDLVRAVGYLSQRPSTVGNESYRSSAHRWVLGSLDCAQQGQILLAHVGPRSHGRPGRWAIVAAALATILFAGALSAGGAQTARITSPITERPEYHRQWPCRWSLDCMVFGRCSPGELPDSSCLAHDDRDCRRSFNCRLLGHCHACHGWCWTLDDARPCPRQNRQHVDDDALGGLLGNSRLDP